MPKSHGKCIAACWAQSQARKGRLLELALPNSRPPWLPGRWRVRLPVVGYSQGPPSQTGWCTLRCTLQSKLDKLSKQCYRLRLTRRTELRSQSCWIVMLQQHSSPTVTFGTSVFFNIYVISSLVTCLCPSVPVVQSSTSFSCCPTIPSCYSVAPDSSVAQEQHQAWHMSRGAKSELHVQRSVEGNLATPASLHSL
jgi:hypothetical protein